MRGSEWRLHLLWGWPVGQVGLGLGVCIPLISKVVLCSHKEYTPESIPTYVLLTYLGTKKKLGKFLDLKLTN